MRLTWSWTFLSPINSQSKCIPEITYLHISILSHAKGLAISPTLISQQCTDMAQLAMLAMQKISDSVRDPRLTWTNVSACAASILMCNVYLHSGVLAIRFVLASSVSWETPWIPVNEPDWFGSWRCGQVVGGRVAKGVGPSTTS